MKVLTFESLAYYNKLLNEKLNNLFTKGLQNCTSCGAPYKNKAVCEYCGRSFFVIDLLTDKQNNVEVNA